MITDVGFDIIVGFMGAGITWLCLLAGSDVYRHRTIHRAVKTTDRVKILWRINQIIKP